MPLQQNQDASVMLVVRQSDKDYDASTTGNDTSN
jgi:hypothetical protein